MKSVSSFLRLIPLWTIIILCILCGCGGSPDIPEDELLSLEATMDKAHSYEDSTLKELDSLKNIANDRRKSEKTRWERNIDLASSYRVINADSALKYSWEAQRIAVEAENPEWDIRSRISAVGSMSTAGLFFAAHDELNRLLDEMPADSTLKVEIWLTARLFYSYSRAYTYGQPKYEQHFSDLYVACDDSLIRYLPANDRMRQFLECERLVVKGRAEEARNMLLPLLESLHEDDNLYGMAAFQLAQAYRSEGNNRQYAAYLAKAAMSDIKVGAKEGLALPELAVYLHSRGDTKNADKAFKYINFALNDAIGGRVRMRTVSLAASIPLIDTAYQKNVKQSHRTLMVSVVGISFLLITSAVLVYFLFRQIKRRRANEQKLKRISRLQEAYIGNFIGLCSNYAERLDSLSRLVGRKLGAGQASDLLKMVESGKFTDENEDFYKIFDNAILDLYPDFIDEVNALLRPEERIAVKDPGRLTAELRIYALIRLGVEESTRIAKILRYSVSTVYSYRNRMRNRAIDRDRFEMEVGKQNMAEE